MILFVVFLLGVATTVQGECEEGCKVPVQHYLEIGCEPVYAKPGDCCPTHFNCDKLEGRSADKCYFNGQVYNKGENIPHEITYEYCLAACRCTKDNFHEFNCAHIDCPEFLGNPLKPGHYRAYEHDKCCSVKEVGPPFDKQAKCIINGKTYYEGQRFNAPNNNFLKCICMPNFTGKFIEPFCVPIKCGTELHAMISIKQNCAPVYYGTSRVCPIQWQCSSDTDTIELAKQRSSIDKKCKYGNLEVNIGGKVLLKRTSPHSPEINCECKIPPLVTCIQKPNEP